MTHALSDLCHSPMLVLAIFVLGIGGTFQYGFQISVLNSPSPYIKKFLNETWLMRYGAALEDWKLNLIWSFIISLYAVGGLIGALNAGHLAVKYGRKRCLLSNNFVAIAGGVMMGLSRRAQSFEMIMVGRFLYGINAGISLNVQTMYLGESAPKRLRGLVSMTVSTFLSTGKLSGQLLGLNEILGSEDLWPVLLAFSVVPALIQLVSLPFFPETPRYLLIDKGDQVQCEKAIQRLWGKGDYRSEIHDMVLEHAAIKGEKSKSVLELILEKSLRWQLLTVIVTFTTLQLCGINAIYLYSFDVFHAAGIPTHQVRYVALGTGLCEIFTSLFCYIAVHIATDQMMMFGGKPDPCALCSLHSIGKISGQENKLYSKLLCGLINKHLGISVDRSEHTELAEEKKTPANKRKNSQQKSKQEAGDQNVEMDTDGEEEDEEGGGSDEGENSEEKKEEKTPDQSTNKVPPQSTLTILGGFEQKAVQKVQRVLPQWLAQPNLVQRDIKKNLIPIGDVPGICPKLLTKLQSNGIQHFFPVQAELIPAVLESALHGLLIGRGGYRPRDICVSAPTGSGKTLAFVIPVVQVCKVFHTYTDGTGLKVVMVAGQKSFAVEQASLVQNITGGCRSLADIVVATPGRLVDHIDKTPGFSLRQLRYLIIDEADRMIDSMHQDWLNYVVKEVYRAQGSLELGSLFRRVEPGPVTAASLWQPQMPLQKLMFSATLTQNPEKLQQLGLHQPRLFTSVHSEKRRSGQGFEPHRTASGQTEEKFNFPQGLTPCRSVYIFAKKNNIPFEFKQLSLSEGQHYSEEFGKINPLRKVPAMKDGDYQLAESIAILLYMCRKFKTPDHWYPSDLQKQAKVDEYLSWQHAAIRAPASKLFWFKFKTPDHWYPSDLQKQAKVDEYLSWQHAAIRAPASKLFWFKLMMPVITGNTTPQAKMDSTLEELNTSLQLFEENFLQDKNFIVGQEISLADIVAIVELMQPLGSGLDIFEGRPKLTAWRERVKASIGKELFDEVHELILNAGDLPKKMEHSVMLPHLKTRLQKMLN
ncbi:UNVERIFIED_CONTAM: hypothetical protein FKN15_024099 [Acipenser sinensis]